MKLTTCFLVLSFTFLFLLSCEEAEEPKEYELHDWTVEYFDPDHDQPYNSDFISEAYDVRLLNHHVYVKFKPWREWWDAREVPKWMCSDKKYHWPSTVLITQVEGSRKVVDWPDYHRL